MAAVQKAAIADIVVEKLEEVKDKNFFSKQILEAIKLADMFEDIQPEEYLAPNTALLTAKFSKTW